MPSGEGGNHPIFQKDVEADKLRHGCLPFDAGPGHNRESVFILSGATTRPPHLNRAGVPNPAIILCVAVQRWRSREAGHAQSAELGNMGGKDFLIMRFGVEYGVDLGRPLLEVDVISFRDAILFEVNFHGRVSHAN
jgi:hypothetical protein